MSVTLLAFTYVWGGPGGARPLAAQQASPSAVQPGPPLAFRNVTVIDVTTGQHLTNRTVVVVGNRIRAVGPARTTRIPSGATVVDARGKYLIPGLWDMHIHHGSTDSYRRMVLAGITGFRNAALVRSEVDSALQWRRDILAGTMVGPPRQILSRDVTNGNGTAPLDTTEFDQIKQSGVDMLKMWQMPRAKYFQFAAQARRVGLPFGGHIGWDTTNSVTAEEISDSGASIIDHVGLDLSGGLDTLCVPNTKPEYQRVSLTACRRAADHLRRNGTWWVPTLMELLKVSRGKQFNVLPQSTGLVASFKDGICDATVRSDSSGLLGLAYRAGMPLLAGTDVGAVGGDPAFMVHRELALMVSEGLPPLAALQAATLNPAKWLHATDSLGTVAPGKLADLVLLDDDPLVNITNTTHVQAVVANGRYLKGERPCR